MKQRIETQNFVNSSLEQLFRDRERILKRFQSVAVELERMETKIAFSSCPYHLGQLVNFRSSLSVSKAIISKVEFLPQNPFYQIYLKKVFHKKRKSNLVSNVVFNMDTVHLLDFGPEFRFTVSENSSISAPRHSCNELKKELLDFLIAENVISVTADADNPLLKEIIDSVNRGKSFTELGFKNDLKSMIDYLNKPFSVKTKSLIATFRKPKLK